MKRPIRVEGDVAYVPLTQGLEAIIDASDAQLVSQWNWCAARRGRQTYARRGWGKGSTYGGIFLHQQILGRPGEGLEIDHWDGNGLNNRRSNLRLVTRAENQMNGPKRSSSSSPFKGVHKYRDKWHARCGRAYLGTFSSQIDAARAYNKAALAEFGEFARINDVEAHPDVPT